jgi:N-formylmaleamate deformylase
MRSLPVPTRDWLSGDVTTNGIRIHFHRTGGDKPPLVLAHGATDNGLCWTRVALALEGDYDVIMPDARGHGLSEAPAIGYTNADHAADLAGLIRGLGLVRPAIGGHSMGAGATLRLIADEPDLVSCAVLEDPGLRDGPWPPPGRADARQGMRQIVEDAQTSDLETTIRRGRERSPLWSDEEWQAWATAKQQLSRAFLESLGSGRPPMGEWREELRRLRCPVLLVTADPDRGAIVTPETAQEASALAPSLEVIRLQGAGHNIRREQFAPFVEAVRAFLAANVMRRVPA